LRRSVSNRNDFPERMRGGGAEARRRNTSRMRPNGRKRSAAQADAGGGCEDELVTRAIVASCATAAEMDEIVAGVLALVAKVMALSADEGSNLSGTNIALPLESFTTISRFIEANLASRELSKKNCIVASAFQLILLFRAMPL
jgi:hypothetical protein